MLTQDEVMPARDNALPAQVMTPSLKPQYAALLSSAQGAQRRQLRLVIAIIAVCCLALWICGVFDLTRFIDGGPAIAQLASEMVPPDFSRWRHWLKPLVDTLAMSIAGTALAVCLSLPLALLAAPNTTPNVWLAKVVRVLLSAMRSVPEIILGILFVAAVGFGALPGVLALALHSVGMVGKFYAEAIEHVDPKPLEAARAAGLKAYILSDEIEGESREVGKVHAALARAAAKGLGPFTKPCVILSGGETTVTIKPQPAGTPKGRGGRAGEFCLGLAQALQGQPGVWALAADTDGIDGVEDNAGAIVTPDSLARGSAAGHDHRRHQRAHLAQHLETLAYRALAQIEPGGDLGEAQRLGRRKHDPINRRHGPR